MKGREISGHSCNEPAPDHRSPPLPHLVAAHGRAEGPATTHAGAAWRGLRRLHSFALWLLVVFVVSAHADAAWAVTPGIYRLSSPFGPGNHVELTVLADGQSVGNTNSYVYGAAAPYCVWGGGLRGPEDHLPPAGPIGADGSFRWHTEVQNPLGVGAQVADTVGRFTSSTTVEASVTLSVCPFNDGPLTVPFTGALVTSAQPPSPAPPAPPSGLLSPDPPLPPGAKPANGHGYPGIPAPTVAPGCEATVKAGELEGVASCWRRAGDVYATTDRARVNGIDLTPARAGIAIRLDRRSQRISSTGPVEVRVGPLRLLRAPLDWRSRQLVFSIAGSSAKVDPGPRFDVETQTFLGLPVDGSVELRLEGGATKLKVSIEAPDDPRLRFLARFAGWSGDLTAAATNDRGLVLDAATVTFPGLEAGFLDITDARLSITRAGDAAYHYDGGATIYPFRLARVGVSGELGFGVGDGYAKIGAGVEQLNRPLLYGLLLQKLAFSMQANPFGIAGSAGVTFGPQFRLRDELISSARLDGGLSYLAGSDGNPGALELTGALELIEAQLADGKVTVSGGSVDVEGNANFTLGDYGIDGRVNGWFDGIRAFNLEGGVNVSLPGPDQGGEAALSNRGVGACRRGFGPDAGFGYRWGAGLGGIDVLGWSCDLGGWREVRAAGGSVAQTAARSVRVPRGLRTIAFSAVGRHGAPRVAFVDPNGTRYEPSTAEHGTVTTDRVLLFQDDATSAEYIAIDRPAPGRWRIEPLAASTPVTGIRSAHPLPAIRIAARISGHGARRVLRFRLRHAAGASVRFLEQGGRSRRTIGVVRRPRGRLRFALSPGRAERRRVLAVIERHGHPTGRQRVVARFRVGRVRPPAPRNVRVHARRYDRVVTWRGPRAARYEVTVRTSDGRKLLYLRTSRRRRVIVNHVPRNVGVRVTITAVTDGGWRSTATRRRA